jgi:L-alanine-DL-glutamate epimerase-like enolase superfamily enzyme
MKITRIDLTPFALPLKAAMKFAAGVLPVTEHVLVEVHTDEGLTGTAEAPSRPFFYGESLPGMIAAVRQWFEPALLGLDPFANERVWEVLDRVEHNNTIKGALDIALHDIVGQAAGIPCRDLLGGYGDTVQATYVCGLGGVDVMVAEAVDISERFGISAFKLKAGLDPAQDGAMLAQMRRALPDAILYIDGNQALNAHEALRLLKEAETHGVAWAEEPCHTHNRAGRRWLAARAPVPILGDESCRTLDEVAREVADETIHLVSIKVARTGYRISRDILALARATRVRPISGSQGDSGIGVAAGWHFCAAFRSMQQTPAELSFMLNLADDLLEDPLIISGGSMTLPRRPGLGIRVDRSKLAHYRMEL